MITKLYEPDRLNLMWNVPHDYRATPGGSFKVATIFTEEGVLRYMYGHPSFDAAKALGFDGYPSFSIGKEIHDQNVEGAFSRRVISKKRLDLPDCAEYHRLDLEEVKKASVFTLLAYTGGRLPKDFYSFIGEW